MRHCARRFGLVAESVRIGVFDAAEEGATPEEVADEVGGDPRAVGIVLDALASMDLLARDGEEYAVKGEGFDLVEGGSQRFTVLHGLEVVESWLTLPEVVETGERYEGGWEVFIRAMGEKDPAYLEDLVSRVLDRMPGAGRVLDVGGGAGDVSAEFGSRGLEVTMLDRGEVLEIARGKVGDDVDLVEGDFLEGLPRSPFDVVYMGHVCHIYGPDTNRRLFEDAFDSLRSGGLLVVNDFVRGVSDRAELFAVNMLVNTEEGGTWTLDQYRSWMEDAGFEDAEMVDLNSAQLLFAEKP